MIDWKIYHADELARMIPQKREQAVEFLRGYFSGDISILDQVKQAIRENPQTWWTGYHMTWGMAVRNLLRRNGYSEKDCGVENLDNVYVGLIEEMLNS